MSRITRRIAQQARDVVDRTGWTARHERGLLSRTLAPHDGDAHVLVAPPGSGNIGDQAMVEAFVANAEAPVRIVMRSAQDFRLPDDLAARAEMLVLPDLMYGGGRSHARDVDALGAILMGARTLSIVGADIMDGAYNLRSAIRRSAFAAAAARAGVPTTILGFSWSPRASPAAIRAIRQAGASGVRLLARDPESATRLRALSVDGVTDVADIVFCDDRRVETTSVVADGTRFALLNTSGLIARSVDQVEDFAAIVEHLRADRIRPVLLPHVVRSSSSDLDVARAVAARVGGDVVLIEEQLAPAQVRDLAARATAIVTGRMHLAVIALSTGRPAVALATQGKVEGLMGLFGSSELCVRPREGMAAEITPLLDRAVDAELSERIRARLPAVRAMAAENTRHLGASAPAEMPHSEGGAG